MKKFNKSKLPAPELVLGKLGIDANKINSQGYFILRCPFHKGGEEKNPSLNLHSASGHYKCHSCGSKGRDILDFYIQNTKKPFKEAVTDLDAWENYNE